MNIDSLYDITSEYNTTSSTSKPIDDNSFLINNNHNNNDEFNLLYNSKLYNNNINGLNDNNYANYNNCKCNCNNNINYQKNFENLLNDQLYSYNINNNNEKYFNRQFDDFKKITHNNNNLSSYKYSNFYNNYKNDPFSISTFYKF